MSGVDIKALEGKIDAIGLLCATLSAAGNPKTADPVLLRIAAMRQKAGEMVPSDPYGAGFCSFEEDILQARKVVALARQMEKGHQEN